ncbi:MAG TPA: DNA polymerase III subunit delta [Candidatus Saccharimonadales bacterium]|nr:DNA polymerase III subunit delta [Candidatus Saccharimonadales bacterium]
MIITLTGSNSFAIDQMLKQSLEPFVASYSELAVERIDASEASPEKVNEAINALPFLSERKLIIIRSPSANKQFDEDFVKTYNLIPDSNDVILIEPKLDKRLTFYKFLKKNTEFYELNQPDQHDLSKWLHTTVKQQNGSISLENAMYLIQRLGHNQQLLSNEIDKLLLFDPKITRQNIDLLTDETPQSNIFQLIDAAFSGQRQQAMRLYKEQRALNVEPPIIIAMLVRQFIIVIIVKTAGNRSIDQIASDAKLNPFVVRKSRNIADKISLSELKNQIKKLLELDISIKRTNIDIDEALQLYLLNLTA